MSIVQVERTKQNLKGGGGVSFDYRSLNGKIVEVFGTQYNFAIAIGLSERSLSLKLNNKVPWKDAEIYKASQLLNIREEEIPKYFFKRKSEEK